MKDKQLFTVTDLGGGDGGKGGIVHKICTEKNAHTIIKVGGAQGSHGVCTSNGQRFNFSQFGCGTFEGVRTHISTQMIMEPYRLLKEADELRYEHGITNIFSYLTIDENTLCSTPYHNIASQLHELQRRNNPKGTIGTGIGEAFNDSHQHPELSIYAKDLQSPDLKRKLQNVRDEKMFDLGYIINSVDSLLPADIAYAKEQIALLEDTTLIDRTVTVFNTVGKAATIVPSTYMERTILSQPGTVVIESSHGVLTDREYGFHPYTSKLRTIPQLTIKMLEEAKYDGEVFKLGVTRAYQIRHGAGPLPTEDSLLLEKLLPGSSKEENRWQGKVRVGPLDLVAVRYAIDVCGGPSFFDGLAISWFDQIKTIGKWDICNEYHSEGLRLGAFQSPTKMRVHPENFIYHRSIQEMMGKELFKSKPKITSYDVQDKSAEELTKLCSDVLLEKLGIPVVLISFGPTEKDKICL